jgi:hypothetical protein
MDHEQSGEGGSLRVGRRDRPHLGTKEGFLMNEFGRMFGIALFVGVVVFILCAALQEAGGLR